MGTMASVRRVRDLVGRANGSLQVQKEDEANQEQEKDDIGEVVLDKRFKTRERSGEHYRFDYCIILQVSTNDKWFFHHICMLEKSGERISKRSR